MKYYCWRLPASYQDGKEHLLFCFHFEASPASSAIPTFLAELPPKVTFFEPLMS
jgi:hypothetical protein